MDDGTLGQVDHNAQPQYHEGKILRRSEVEGIFGQSRREEGEKTNRDRSRNEGTESRHPESRSRFSITGHLVTVEAGHDRCGLSWDIDQNGGGGSSVHGTIRDTCKQYDRRSGGHVKSNG